MVSDQVPLFRRSYKTHNRKKTKQKEPDTRGRHTAGLQLWPLSPSTKLHSTRLLGYLLSHSRLQVPRFPRCIGKGRKEVDCKPVSVLGFPPVPFPQPNGCWRIFLTPTGLFPSSSETLPGDQVHCKSPVPLWNVGNGFGSEGRERSTLWGDDRLLSHSRWGGKMSGKVREKNQGKPVKLALCLMLVLKTSPWAFPGCASAGPLFSHLSQPC